MSNKINSGDRDVASRMDELASAKKQKKQGGNDREKVLGKQERLPLKVHIMQLWQDIVAMVRTRRFKRGGAAIVLTVLFVLFVVLTNLVARGLTERYAVLSPDLTKNRIYTLSDVTKELLEGLDMHVEIDIIATEAACMNPGLDVDPYGHIPLATELIKRYAQYTDNLRVEFIDLGTYPGFLELIPEYRDSIYDYSVVVRSPLRSRVTSFYEMLPSLTASAATDSASVDIASSLTETVISSLIKTVTISTVPAVAYLDELGGGESVDYLLNELSINGYDIYNSYEFNFGYEPIPEAVQTVIIAAPQYDLTISQLNSLVDFLENGGQYGKSLLCFTSSISPDMPNLNTLLDEWGIKLTRNAVYEGDTSMHIPTLGSDVFYTTMHSSEYITDAITEKRIPVAGALELSIPRDTLGGSIVVNPILSTTSNGYVAPIGAEFTADSANPADAALRCIMAESTLYKTDEDGTQRRSDVIVAPVSLCSPDYIGAASYSNRAMLMRVCSLRCGITDESLDIESKTLTAVDFSVTNNAVIAVTVILGYLLPVAVLILGFIVFFRRRRL
ncbi:MAG: hypothetical protein E7559_05340 [Ruminococcaceae bacterium]|nr:hypothetical protein [Oscillospiraceae bacterium]